LEPTLTFPTPPGKALTYAGSANNEIGLKPVGKY